MRIVGSKISRPSYETREHYNRWITVRDMMSIIQMGGNTTLKVVRARYPAESEKRCKTTSIMAIGQARSRGTPQSALCGELG